jgi:hypothetical protein
VRGGCENPAGGRADGMAAIVEWGGPIFKFICQSYLHPALVKEKVGIT